MIIIAHCLWNIPWQIPLEQEEVHHGDSQTGGQGRQPSRIDSAMPHPARTWNYWLGGRTTIPSTTRPVSRL